MFSCSILGEKIGHNHFFKGKFAFFSQKFDFSSTSWVLKNWSYYFHSICRNTCWTLTVRPVRFVTLDFTRKKDTKLFHSLERLPFFKKKKCDFNNLLGLKKRLWQATQYWWEQFLDPCKMFLEVYQTRYYKEIGPKILSPENSYFLKCLSLSTSKVPKKWWYLLHNNCQNTLGTFFTMMDSDFFMFDNWRKKGPQNFFQWKVCLVLQKFVFSTSS